MTVRSIITGIGAHLPKKILTNDDLVKIVDTSDEWIVERTGIRQRHIAADGEKTSDLAIKAGEKAIAAAGLSGDDIDMFIIATFTPDLTFPATAARVQAALGRPGVPAFDLQAVCSGFVYALAVANNFIVAGQSKNTLLIGCETISRLIDWKDRSTCVLFGDGAGAVVLKAEDGGQGTSTDRGILSTHLFSDGRMHDYLCSDGGPSSTQTTGYIQMQGKEVYRHAVVNMAQAIEEAVNANGVGVDQIDWLLPHQASKRIIDGTTKRLGFRQEKVIVTVDRHANTSAASIPLALAQGVDDGRIKPGELVLMVAMGGGFTWGSALVRM